MCIPDDAGVDALAETRVIGAMLFAADKYRESPESVSEVYGTPVSAPADYDALTIGMPLDGFTDESLANLEKLIASKAGLIRKALGVDTLSLEKIDGRLFFPWFRPGLEQEHIDAYTIFISTLCRAAKGQKRVTAKEKQVDNEKFAFRVFLIRLPGRLALDLAELQSPAK